MGKNGRDGTSASQAGTRPSKDAENGLLFKLDDLASVDTG
jgi:hypothetical protein